MKLLWISGTAAFILALGAVSASAQPVISAKSGTIALVEGKVYLNDQLVEPSLTKFPDVKENGVVRTEEGRTEVLLTPGVSLHLGENGSFKLITNRLIDTRLELLTGSAVVDALEIAKDTNVTLVCKEGTVAIAKAGHFRFDTNPARIKVFAGVADVTLKGEHIEVPAAKMLSLSGDSATAEKFDSDDTDSLDNWARRRGEEMAVANVSAAKHTYDTYGSVSPGGGWTFNPYFGLYTYIPYSGRYCDPYYGYCYWSPGYVNRLFYNPGGLLWQQRRRRVPRRARLLYHGRDIERILRRDGFVSGGFRQPWRRGWYGFERRRPRPAPHRWDMAPREAVAARVAAAVTGTRRIGWPDRPFGPVPFQVVKAPQMRNLGSEPRHQAAQISDALSALTIGVLSLATRHAVDGIGGWRASRSVRLPRRADGAGFRCKSRSAAGGWRGGAWIPARRTSPGLWPGGSP